MNRRACTSSVASGKGGTPGLRAQLLALGYTPGPITDKTRATYERKLRELQEQERRVCYRVQESDDDSQSDDGSQSGDDSQSDGGSHSDNDDEEVNGISSQLNSLAVGRETASTSSYRRNPFGVSTLKTRQGVETDKYLQDVNWTRDLRQYEQLETEARSDFYRKKNMGTRDFYTYLLLDPRVTKSLYSKAGNKHSNWTIFVKSVFYIGRGTGNRHTQHLRDALKIRDGRDKTSPTTDKIQCIMDIWSNNKGVICFFAFDDLVEMEACTYEAAMIDALGLPRLTNEIRGSYYFSGDWPLVDRRKLGFYLLYKSMQEFLKHGEEQIFPEDLYRRRQSRNPN